jgi:hypothetical protein
VAGLFVSRRRALGQAAFFAAVAGIVGGTRVPTHSVAQESGTTVPFDHAIHAGQYDMPCLGCHVYAGSSPSAGLPSVRKCMGCHKFIAKDKPGVQALAALFEQGQPPRWLRVTRLPDFIYFSHRMHVRSKVACSDCHGEVKAMHMVVPAAQLTMGRCLGCHGERNATVDCIACHK